MKTIYVATKARGFLLTLFNYNNSMFKFIYEKENVYETNSRKKKFISKLVKLPVADHLGVIQRIKLKEEKAEKVFSYNRFLKLKTEYLIYLENPLALVHYSTNRHKTFLGNLKLKKYFNDPNLKGIVCLSKACYETISKFYDIPSNVIVEQIYPLVLNDSLLGLDGIVKKSHNQDVFCLYVSSDFTLKGGEDILEAFDMLSSAGMNNIKLKIITRIDNIEDKLIKKIKLNTNIELCEFNYNKDELREIYINSNILLNPSRQDSFSLVTLEAMKAGNVILTTDLYALTEMVEDEYNGFLVEPKYRFFNKNNMPNEAVWNNRNKTIYSKYIDERIVNFLYEKLSVLNSNRDMLEKMALNSYKRASQGEFSEDYIINKWKEVL